MNFPSSPALNQTYTYGSSTWKWNGTAWDFQSAGTSTGGGGGSSGGGGGGGSSGGGGGVVIIGGGSPGPVATSGNRPEVLLVPDENGILTPNGELSNRFRFVMDKDIKLANPINFYSNEHIYLTGYQDITGGRKLNYGLLLMLPNAQPFVPPQNSNAAFLMELRPTINLASGDVNWAVWGYPDASVAGGFGLTTELARIGNTYYFMLGGVAGLGAFNLIKPGEKVYILRNGLSTEATGTIVGDWNGLTSPTFLVAGAPVNGLRPKLELLQVDFGEGPPRGANRPAYGKALLNLEADMTAEIRDLRITGARNESWDARGIGVNNGKQFVTLRNLEVTNCNNGILWANEDFKGRVDIIDCVFDANGVGGQGPSGPNSSGYVHNLYAGYNNQTWTALRSSFTNSVTGHNIKTRAGMAILDQVLTRGATEGRELDLPFGGGVRATNCIFHKLVNAQQGNLVGIGQEGIMTDRVREYTFTNCRFQNDIVSTGGRDISFFICFDRQTRLRFIDCEFVGAAALALNDNGPDSQYIGMETVKGIRYYPEVPPEFIFTGGPIGPLPGVQVGYAPTPMMPIEA